MLLPVAVAYLKVPTITMWSLRAFIWTVTRPFRFCLVRIGRFLLLVQFAFGFTPSSWSLQYVAYVVTDCCISFCFSSVVIVRVVFPWTFSPKFTDPESRCYSPAVSLHQRDVAQLAYSPGHFQRGIGCKESVQDFKTSLEDDGLWIRCKCECRDTKRYYVVMWP